MAKQVSSENTTDPILAEAQDRFEFALQWENEARKHFLDDLKFVEADSDNGYQWPNDLRYNRDMEERPTLTINKTRQHCLLIMNDAKQNKPAIKFMPTGGGATFEAAQVWTALARRIEYQSNAQSAYSKASEFQVKCGVGYWRIVTDYVDENSFDQDIFIRRVNDPLKILIDPEAQEADKSDMRYAFVFEDYNSDEFKKRFPKYKDKVGQNILSAGGDWVWDDMVRVAEYFRIVETEDTLFLLEDGSAVKKSDLSATPDILKETQEKAKASRTIKKKEVKWHFVVGNEIVDTKTWPGKYIPLVQVVGEEVVIDGKLDRKGHTRAMKDPQRMYNYWSSAAVEYGALQNKIPYVAPAEAIEGYETYWETANRQNHAVLPYNAYNDAGQQIAPPQRQTPPVSSPVAVTGMQIAGQEMEMVSGQYAPAMGQPDNTRTGAAINERQRQGDKATYHYIDGLAEGIRFTGKILLDLIPKIYDTPRVLQIMAEDGTTLAIKIDPEQAQIHQAEMNENQEVVQRILNPNMGQFEVQADVGPGYATRREEAFNAISLILTQAPQLAGVVGDLMFKSADFPMADEIAERLRRMVPPQALGKGPTPNEQALQQQLTILQENMVKLGDQLATERLRSRNKAEQKEIGVFNAQTNRLKVMGDLAKNGVDASREAAQLELDLKNTKTPLGAANQEANEDMGNVGGSSSQGADPMDLMKQVRQAPDGNHYVPDPNRPGKYLKVVLNGGNNG